MKRNEGPVVALMLITECCDVEIAEDWRFCPKCGAEARVKTYKPMTKLVNCPACDGHGYRFDGPVDQPCMVCRTSGEVRVQ